MQNSYYVADRLMCREGNVIYLTEYCRRQKQAAVHERETKNLPYPAYGSFAGTSRMKAREERRRRRRVRQAWTLDVCASLGVVILTAAFTVRVLMG